MGRVDSMAYLTAPGVRKLQAVNWWWGYASRAAAAHSRAQRVGILDHIGPAAGRRARGEQYEARSHEGAAREIAPHRQIVGDILARRIMQPRQRHMGGEFAPFGIEPHALHHPLKFGLQLDQRPARLDGGDHCPRLAAAEALQALQLDLERLAVDPKQHRGDFVRRHAVDIADEAQGDVIIFGIDPARARKAATQIGKGLANLGRNFQSGKQTRHRSTPDAEPGNESPITNFYLTYVTLRSSRRQSTGKLRGKPPLKVICCPFFSCVAQTAGREVPPPWAEYSSR